MLMQKNKEEERITFTLDFVPFQFRLSLQFLLSIFFRLFLGNSFKRAVHFKNKKFSDPVSLTFFFNHFYIVASMFGRMEQTLPQSSAKSLNSVKCEK